MVADGDETFEVTGLGRLSAVDGSPPGQRFWAGTTTYDDEGPVEGPWYVCADGDGRPDDERLTCARDVLADLDGHIRSARSLLARLLAEDPELFGTTAEEAARLLARGERLLPFGMPEPTFYEPGSWQLRFAECPLPACEELGVSVDFTGGDPTGASPLDGAEELG